MADDHTYCFNDIQTITLDEDDGDQQQEKENHSGTESIMMNRPADAPPMKIRRGLYNFERARALVQNLNFSQCNINLSQYLAAKKRSQPTQILELPQKSLLTPSGQCSTSSSIVLLTNTTSNSSGGSRALSPSQEPKLNSVEPDPKIEEVILRANGFLMDVVVCNTRWQDPTRATIGQLEAIHLATEADGDCQMKKFYGGYPTSDIDVDLDIEILSISKGKRRDSATAVDYENEDCLRPITEDNQWAVEKILRKRKTLTEDGKRIMSYYIKWEGWDYNFCTWEEHTEANNLDRLVKSFERRAKWRTCIFLRESRGHKSAAFERAFKCFKNSYLNWFSNKATFFACHRWEDEINKVLKKWESRIKCKQAPLYVENWVDDQAPPVNFEFILENKLSEEAVKSAKGFMKLEWCMCKRNGIECGSANNCCPEIFGQNYCYKEGTKIDAVRAGNNWIVECTDGCSCDINCPTRVIQRGRRIPLVLFRTADRGWSLRTTIHIERNQFVCEYVGEVLTVDEAFTMNKPSTYQFQMDGAGEHKLKFVVDAAEFGNEARFINHSCSPNLIVRSVLADRLDDCYHRIAFFAKRDIKAGEEVTIDYCAIDSNAQGRQKVKCNCNTRTCRGFFYY